MISIVDFGMGNISSVLNAFQYWKQDVKVICTPQEIEASTKLVLPGVGSFREAMESLKKRDLIDALNAAVLIEKIPILGICLGMQIMACEGEEDGGSEGLGWVEGKVVSLKQPNMPTTLSIPHVGFNSVSNLDNTVQRDYYFCHSYKLISNSSDFQFEFCEYGQKFIAALKNRNIWATQFHPEKSQSNGLLLLKNFIELRQESA